MQDTIRCYYQAAYQDVLQLQNWDILSTSNIINHGWTGICESSDASVSVIKEYVKLLLITKKSKYVWFILRHLY